MKIPFKVTDRKANRKFAATVCGILVVFGLVMLTRLPGPLRNGMDAVNNLFSDNYYRLRRPEDRTDSQVMIVAVDQASLTDVDMTTGFPWPWPRSFWGLIATYLADHGAKVIAFDEFFSETSQYQQKTSPDDKDFARAINKIKIPIVFATLAKPDGTFIPFAPAFKMVKKPWLAAANIADDKTIREYNPYPYSKDSLAVATVKASKAVCDFPSAPFLLHYYGPSNIDRQQQTFRYVPADSVLAVAAPSNTPMYKNIGFDPDLFRGKIVIIGLTAAGTHDTKSSPISTDIAGVEVQATAVSNLLAHQYVATVTPLLYRTLLPLLCAAVTGFGVIYPRRAEVKLLFPAGMLVGLLGAGIFLFSRSQIEWLPPAHTLLALLIATPAAFSYTYLIEDRDRRFMLSALKKMISPTIAEQLANNPQLLQRQSKLTEVTILFSDLANFTKMSEGMDVNDLTEHLNSYLSDLSIQVIRHNGTLDKFIGDSVMSFWNAPVTQADHAVLACRAALAMQKCRQDFTITSADQQVKIYTRIGVNSTMAAVGFIGSADLFDYTALGDGVNLASRLEGANKFYGSRILISESTQQQVADHFYLRRLDRLRVKGKNRSIDVYELLGDRNHPDPVIEKRIEVYNQAFDAYQNQTWGVAHKILVESRATFGDDAPIAALQARIEGFPDQKPPPGWDGVYEAEGK